MSKNRNRGTEAFSGVIPQGHTGRSAAYNPKSELENKAKRSNTKR
ncbi:small, acid-soluble spore protein L [Peribacillus saganii]|uniref:Small, acid-soluble spore protein L n=1 Tax=Peribacillus saganii TaxID=2303992 RepID=A0A372LFD7_9BACI|nr:small, acid-soluble spore protein L [Peribacillus saganii]RFU64075.1 small, acid-soluble spore protein L [Peribacillus saganii]